jgi:hypothetical protein
MTYPKDLLGVWRSMQNRCYCKSQKAYKDYGGRGISVEAIWRGPEGFKRFLVDMGPRPLGGTVDRIDNEKNYGPSNCEWATRYAQARNKRNNRMITAGGKTQTLVDWAREMGCSHGAILYRINKGMSAEQAVTLPIEKRPNSKLNEQDVLFILQTYPTMTSQALADKLHVSKKTILNVIHGKTFVDVLKGL